MKTYHEYGMQHHLHPEMLNDITDPEGVLDHTLRLVNSKLIRAVKESGDTPDWETYRLVVSARKDVLHDQIILCFDAHLVATFEESDD